MKTKAELEKEVRMLRGQLSAKYQVTHVPWVYDPSHKHAFEEWELASDSGIAFCMWKCKCGLEVAQCLAERLRPEKIPGGELHRFQEWREG